MGTIGSKEDLGQIVVIYGYNPNDFGWRQNDDRMIYHTSGLIICCSGKKYIMTTRTRLISCKNIVMYHCYFRGTEPVMRNNLRILFQSIDYNIIILGTIGTNELDLTKSEIISSDCEQKYICPFNDIDKNDFIIPTKKSNYYTIRMDMDLDSDTINFPVHIYAVKYIQPIIYDKTFVPRNYIYNFIIKNNNCDLVGICGAIIFNKKHQLIGMISRTEKKNLFVLPTKVLVKIVKDFSQNLDEPDKYTGPLILPFNYKLSKNNDVIIASDCLVETTNGDTKILKKYDKLISINGNYIFVRDKNAVVFDDHYKENVPLDIYIKLNISNHTLINLVLTRKKIFMNVILHGIRARDPIISLTNQPYFYPSTSIPYKMIGSLIIVELTHELFDITMLNKIILKNNTIDDFFENSLDKIDKRLIIIDCLDSQMTKKYNLPQILTNKKQTIICPTVLMVNGKNVYILNDLEDSNEIISINTVVAKTNNGDEFKIVF